MSLLKELNETIRFLEADIPASPARNENIEQGLRREVARYFGSLDDALDWNALEQIYYRNVKQE